MLFWAAALLVAAQMPAVEVMPAYDPATTTLMSKPGKRFDGRTLDGALSFERELSVHLGPDGPQVSYTSQVALRPFDKRVVAFYQVIGRDRARRFIARSVATFGPRPLQPLWADSRTCPAVLVRLKTLDRFPLVVAAPYGLTTRPAGGLNLDGIGIELRGMALVGETEPVELRISSNADALVDWADSTNRAIDPCLSVELPKDLPASTTEEDRRRLYPSPTPAAPPPPPGGPASSAGPEPRPAPG